MTSNRAREGSPWQIAFRKFFSNRISFGASIFVFVIALIAILGYAITPDSTPWANNQHLELAARQPGLQSSFLLVPTTKSQTGLSFFGKMFKGDQSSFREIPIKSYNFNQWEVVITEFTDSDDGLVIEKSFNLVDLLFPFDSVSYNNTPNDTTVFVNYSPSQHFDKYGLYDMFEKTRVKQRTFLLGTDRFGRDMLSRLIIGARVSLTVGFIAVLISLIIGVTLGAVAGYARGWVDDLVMWFMNVVWSIPTLLMVIALTMVIGKGFWQIFVAVGLTMWVEVARIVRGQVISLREKEFVEAAKIMGFGSSTIIFRHILPNVLGPVVIVAAGNFSTAILLEAGLSFLGIGVQPPIPSWGTMIKDHYGYIIMDRAFLAILPGVAIMLLVLAFTFIGNGLRDALDTKEKP